MGVDSIKAIKERYKDEWVLISDYDLDDFCEPLDGMVVAHSKDRDEIYDKQMAIEKDLCILYTGEIPPKDVAVMF